MDAAIDADISCSRQVIGAALRSYTDGHQVIEVVIAADALNRMLEPGGPEYVRVVI